jgi:MFS family permease
MSEHPRRKVGRQIIVDVTPLRESVPFRWLYLGTMAGFVGRQITVVAVPFQVFLLTNSSLAVGMLGVVQLVPLLLAALVAGAFIDAFDRRRILVVSQILLAATALGLAYNASQTAPLIWPIYVLSALNAGLSTLDLPTRMAMVPSLVRRDHFPAAMALQQTMVNVGHAVVPAVAGLLLARLSITAAYLAEAAAFLVAAALVRRLPRMQPEGGGRAVGFGSIGEGLRYLRGQRLIKATFLIDINAMVFGMPRALFPAIGTGLFGGDASTVGLLHAAPGVGAFLAALTSGWVGNIQRKGRAVIYAVIVWGLAITAFGLVRSLPIALLALAVAGGADVVSAVFRATILQLTVPDALRGRLSAIHIAVVSGGPRLGDAEAGAVAALTSLRFSVVSGGMACLFGALAVMRFMPDLWRYGEPAPARE